MNSALLEAILAKIESINHFYDIQFDMPTPFGGKVYLYRKEGENFLSVEYELTPEGAYYFLCGVAYCLDNGVIG